MAKVIWKFPLEIHDSQVIAMPDNSEILTVQMQNGIACLWAIVDDQKQKRFKTIEVYGTGHPMPPGNRRYIGTFQLQDGILIFHVFEWLG